MSRTIACMSPASSKRTPARAPIALRASAPAAGPKFSAPSGTVGFGDILETAVEAGLGAPDLWNRWWVYGTDSFDRAGRRVVTVLATENCKRKRVAGCTGLE